MRGQQKVKDFHYIIFIDYKKGNFDTNIDSALKALIIMVLNSYIVIFSITNT